MESLPTEILDHIFNQFPNKCEICQEKCLRSSLRQELSTYSKTSERWNRIIEKKVKKFEQSNKCYSDFENVYAVTLNIQPKEKPLVSISIFIARIMMFEAIGMICEENRFALHPVKHKTIDFELKFHTKQ